VRSLKGESPYDDPLLIAVDGVHTKESAQNDTAKHPWQHALEETVVALGDKVEASKKIVALYFEIAEELVGEKEVRRRFKERFGVALSETERSAPQPVNLAEQLAFAERVAKGCAPTDTPKQIVMYALSLLPAHGGSSKVPEGWKLVPRKATPEMVVDGTRCTGSVSKALDCYTAMLIAAPSLSVNEESK
jgi:hypothetical protein